MIAEERFDDLASQYLDGDLDDDGAGELNALLSSRPDYARRFVRLSRVHGGLRELQAPPFPRGLGGEQALEAWLAPTRARRRMRSLAWIAIAAATILALVLVLLCRS